MNVVTTSDVSHAGARSIVDRIVAGAAAEGYGVSVAVVDTAGTLVAVERMDGAPRFSVDLAINKARTAATFGRSTAEMEANVGDRLAFATSFVEHGGWYLGRGGFPIVVDGACVGGVGVSGNTAEREEDLAREASTSLT